MITGVGSKVYIRSPKPHLILRQVRPPLLSHKHLLQEQVKMATSHIDITKTLANNTNAKWWKDPGMKKLNFMIVRVITAQTTCGYDEAVVGNF